LSTWRPHPYRSPEEIRTLVERLRRGPEHLIHPQHIVHDLRRSRPWFGRFNGWLADHIVGLAGTMGFFYLLVLLMGGWAYWQSTLETNSGFDPFPYAFLFFILGGIMQSLFVPTMLTASNRTAERDRIKDEADHRAWSHLYDVNNEQLQLLRRLVAALDATGQSPPPASEPKPTG
jgi:uncharacterized membrane protein